MKNLKKNVRKYFISRLTLKQKAQLKYLIALFSPANIRELLWSVTSQNRSPREFELNYEKFRPTRIYENLMRIGGSNDGGYLIPNITVSFDGLISPGVGESSKFELEFSQNQIKTVLLDASVVEPSNLPNNFLFLPKFLSSFDSSNLISLSTLVQNYFQKCNNLVLQMDIEGSEYEVLNNLEESDFDPFGLILIEFHNLEKIRRTGERAKILDALELLSREFVLVHSHANNAGGFFVHRYRKYPQVLETTWARKGLVTVLCGKSELPHPLDQDNDQLIYSLAFPLFRGD